MTKFETLVACRNHWQWLAITGDDNKDTYEPAHNWLNWCACCEYIDPDDEDDACFDCPLNRIAWGDRARADFYSCYPRTSEVEEEGAWSFYYDWHHAGTEEDRKDAAHNMVCACNVAIERMIANGEELK